MAALLPQNTDSECPQPSICAANGAGSDLLLLRTSLTSGRDVMQGWDVISHPGRAPALSSEHRPITMLCRVSTLHKAAVISSRLPHG